jgi:hypothetical protein
MYKDRIGIDSRGNSCWSRILCDLYIPLEVDCMTSGVHKVDLPVDLKVSVYCNAFISYVKSKFARISIYMCY